MPDIRLQDIIDINDNTVVGYTLFREIEDWCTDTIKAGKWRFDYSSTVDLYGVIVPGRILFKARDDYEKFLCTFKKE